MTLSPTRPRSVALLATASALLVAGVLVGAVVADDHTREEAPHYGPDESGNATFEFLEQEDHYPGAENVSVRYTLKGGDVFGDVGASDGVAADWFVVETDAVDHGDCEVENVATFGIDRGDDGSDGAYDEDLLQHTRRASFFEDGVVIEFYDDEDLGGDPPVVHADDRIVLELSEEAAGGGCGDTTSEKGWYTAETFLNGTGPREQNRSDERYGFTVESERNYVCYCDSEAEARERLGPPTSTPTPTETPGGTETPTPTPTDRPRTPTPDDTPILTATVDESVGNASVSANASVDEDGVSANASVDALGGAAAADIPSPTPADGPGFGAGVTALALLGSSLLARRRRGESR